MKNRIIFLQTKRPPMRAEEMRAALGALDEDAPALAAFRQLLDEEMGAAMLDASSPVVTEAQRAHAGGRIDALATVRARLEELKNGRE
jgi:hypothetical protein